MWMFWILSLDSIVSISNNVVGEWKKGCWLRQFGYITFDLRGGWRVAAIRIEHEIVNRPHLLIFHLRHAKCANFATSFFYQKHRWYGYKFRSSEESATCWKLKILVHYRIWSGTVPHCCRIDVLSSFSFHFVFFYFKYLLNKISFV